MGSLNGKLLLNTTYDEAPVGIPYVHYHTGDFFFVGGIHSGGHAVCSGSGMSRNFFLGPLLRRLLAGSTFNVYVER